MQDKDKKQQIIMRVDSDLWERLERVRDAMVERFGTRRITNNALALSAIVKGLPEIEEELGLTDDT